MRSINTRYLIPVAALVGVVAVAVVLLSGLGSERDTAEAGNGIPGQGQYLVCHFALGESFAGTLILDTRRWMGARSTPSASRP